MTTKPKLTALITMLDAGYFLLDVLPDLSNNITVRSGRISIRSASKRDLK